MADYSQTRSFNLGIAQEISVEAALIYDEMKFASSGKTRADGWFYKSYEKLQKRLPFSENTFRKHINKLIEAGWLEKKVMKVEGNPTCHYKIARFLTASSAVSIETASSAVSNINTTIKTTTTIKKDSAKSPLQKAIADFRGHRKQMKRPLTTRAEELIIKRLEGWYPGDVARQCAAIDQAIEMGWQSVYELRVDPRERQNSNIRKI